MWILSDVAISDLDVMVEWGARTFGQRQSEEYELRVVSMFDTLADNPGLGRIRQSASGPVRVMPCNAHSIVYREEAGNIAILRVLSHRQNLLDKI